MTQNWRHLMLQSIYIHFHLHLSLSVWQLHTTTAALGLGIMECCTFAVKIDITFSGIGPPLTWGRRDFLLLHAWKVSHRSFSGLRHKQWEPQWIYILYSSHALSLQKSSCPSSSVSCWLPKFSCGSWCLQKAAISSANGLKQTKLSMITT